MLNRRSFLHWTGTAGLGLSTTQPILSAEKPSGDPPLFPNDFEQSVAGLRSFDAIGRPTSWNLVRERLHPISPERVMVITENGGDGQHRVEAPLHSELLEESNLTQSKLDLISRLMHVMSDHSGASESCLSWATTLVKREALASTGMGYGFGLLHQFQNDDVVKLTNPPVDWWLILFPEGIEWDALDGEPVYGMIGHVFVRNPYRIPGSSIRVWELASRVVQKIADDEGKDAWQRIAQMDRITAAQFVNARIVAACR